MPPKDHQCAYEATMRDKLDKVTGEVSEIKTQTGKNEVHLGHILKGIDDIREDSKADKVSIDGNIKDLHEKININSKDIANQKGWMAAIATVAGALGGFLKGLVFKQ